MMTRFLLIIIVFVCHFVQAQTVRGVLKDEESNQTISYATILIPELKISTMSKADGSFVLAPPDEKDYLIRIEPFGYHPKEARISEIKKATVILMQEAPELMPELFIPPKNAKIKYYNYGRTSEGSSTMVGSIQSYNYEDYHKGLRFGMMMKNKGFSQLESFHIHIHSVTYKKLYYRLQLYNIEKGLPAGKINHSEILFSIAQAQKGWIKLNLENHNVFLDENIKNFAAVLELVHADFSDSEKEGQPDQLDFNISLSLSNQMVGRNGYYEEWTKIPMTIPMYFHVKCYK